ncbi:MAG: hypothetical protein WBF42_11515, partial [Terracidiphilus sp.]
RQTCLIGLRNRVHPAEFREISLPASSCSRIRSVTAQANDGFDPVENTTKTGENTLKTLKDIDLKRRRPDEDAAIRLLEGLSAIY